MFFGLTNSPATFQTMMNHIFRPIIAKHELLGTSIHVYMDDIAIAMHTSNDDHTVAVTDVLTLAAEHDLYFKLEKCLFHIPSIDYLGVILEKGVICMDLVKIAGIKNWPTPKKVKDICSFLGFCNFYRAFIKGFLSIARSLNALTKKDQMWTWTEEHQKAFDTLKARVTSEPILAHPKLDKQFELEVDTSGFAVGAVLLQKKDDGKQHPVGYYSTTLNAAEQNYDIYNLELLAIVKALKHWRPLLTGSPHKIKVFSDQMNLKYWRDPQKISQCVAREVLKLSEYDLEIHHIKGTLNGCADALSRRPDYDQGEDNNKDIVVPLDNLFVRASHLEWIEEEEPRHVFQVEDMTKEHPIYEQDEAILKPWADPHHLKKINDTWYKDGRQVVTNDLEHRQSLIQSHHDLPVYGHPGINRTI